MDVKYNRVKIASDETTSQMSNASLGKSIKKCNVLFIEEEHVMFSQVVYQPTFPYGFNFSFGYFCIRNFFICGYSKLQNAKFEKFVLVQLPTGLVLRFCERVSKNKSINVTKCFVGGHQPTIDCPIPNVISIFKELTCQCPTVWPKSGFHPLFLHS
jgi:hypothetical protein